MSAESFPPYTTQADTGSIVFIELYPGLCKIYSFITHLFMILWCKVSPAFYCKWGLYNYIKLYC